MTKNENKWKNVTFNKITGKIIHQLIDLFIVFSRQLLRQHKAKLHKRAKEIQEQLVRLNLILRLKFFCL